MSAAAPNPLNEFEQKLKSLEPLPGGLARDRLLFEAGRRSAKPSRVWPASSALLMLVCVVLSARFLFLPGPPERMAEAPHAKQAVPTAARQAPAAFPMPLKETWALDRLSIGQMQNAMLKFGADAATSFLADGQGPVAFNAGPPPSILNLEAEALLGRRLSPTPAWSAWLPFGGVR